MPHVLEVASLKAHLYLWQLVLSRDDRMPRTGHRKVHNGQIVLFEKSCLPKDVVKLYIYNFFVSSSLFGIFLRHILYQENIPQIYHNNIGILSLEFCGARFKRYFWQHVTSATKVDGAKSRQWQKLIFQHYSSSEKMNGDRSLLVLSRIC